MTKGGNEQHSASEALEGWSKEEMADVVIEQFRAGCSVNLGIGLPTLIAERIDADFEIVVHSENGVLGVSGRPSQADLSPTRINAGKESIAVANGASYFDSALSFGMIRGGHIDFCVLGGMEVDAEGNLANWMIPGKKVTGMGGAMDLVNGAKTVIVMLQHFAKDGSVKLLPKCTLPLTGVDVVDLVVTNLGLFAITNNKFQVLRLADGISRNDLGIDASLLQV